MSYVTTLIVIFPTVLLLLDATEVTESPAPLHQCYRHVTGEDVAIETCKKGQRCCIGIVPGKLADNQTLPISKGHCWHETGTCNEVCFHRYHAQSDISICECRGSLCNYNITWKVQPVPEELVPITRAPLPTPRKPIPVYQIVGAVVGSVASCCLMSLLAVYVYRRFIRMHPFSTLRDGVGEDGEPLVPQFPNGKTIGPQFGREHEIEIIKDIGHGRYGQVQQAKVSDSFVAIKKFSQYDRQSFVNELMIMSEKQDLNLLCLLGHIDNPINGQLWLITEFMPLGNMSDYLRNNTLTVPQALHLLSTFISGLCYLHSEPNPVAHRDIKTRNVLLCDHRTAKLADFGLALLLDYGPGGALNDKAAPPTQVGTARYMAPEVLEGSMFYKEAEAHMRIDVYAASLVMWEVMWRTQLDQRDTVPAYQLPFERQIPGHPTPCEMQALVAVEKQRPELRDPWINHPVFSKLEVTLTESWDNDENARLSSKTIQARLLPMLSNESDSEVSV